MSSLKYEIRQVKEISRRFWNLKSFLEKNISQKNGNEVGSELETRKPEVAIEWNVSSKICEMHLAFIQIYFYAFQMTILPSTPLARMV
jgi:hypothetical protein